MALGQKGPLQTYGRNWSCVSSTAELDIPAHFTTDMMYGGTVDGRAFDPQTHSTASVFQSITEHELA